MVRFIKFKALIITFTLIGLSSITFAQYSGGGRVGVNLANLGGSSIQNNKMIIGYNVGGFVNYSFEDLISGEIGNILSVQVELCVQTKGTSTEYPFIKPDSTIEVKKDIIKNFTYIQLPVLARFTFGESGEFNYFGEAGFYGASLFGLTIDGEKSHDHDLDPGTDPRKYREEYSGFDFGLCVGGGVIIPFGGRKSPWAAYVNARYSLGLYNIGEIKDETPEFLDESLKNIKTNTISVLAGVIYKF